MSHLPITQNQQRYHLYMARLSEHVEGLQALQGVAMIG
jgi:hypothetical protein